MFRASLAHHQELRNCVCSLDVVLNCHWFCLSLSHAVSVKCLVAPGSVCVGCPLGSVHCVAALTISLYWCGSLVSVCAIMYCRVWFARFCVDCGDGQDYFIWVPVCTGVSRSLTEWAVICVVTSACGSDASRCCVPLSLILFLSWSHAVCVKSLASPGSVWVLVVCWVVCAVIVAALYFTILM